MKLEKFNLIDLTHTLTPDIATWHGNCGFNYEIESDYDDHANSSFRVQTLQMNAGIGTHMDAPAHCVAGASDIANIPLNQLINACVIIDVSHLAHENYMVYCDDILAFEKQHGVIAANSLVLIYTGWEKHWHQPKKYRNQLKFPTISKEAAQMLLERDICGLGIDTLSPDRLNQGFPVHQLFLNAGKFIIENVANANKLPPIGTTIIALPLKMRNATESPIRLIALVEKSAT